MKRLASTLKALLWTIVLAAVVLAADRLLLGPSRSVGWVVVGSVRALERSMEPVLLPSYLPEALSWPPARVFRRDGRRPGWWMEIEPRRTPGPVLWLGIGSPVPDAMRAAARCLPASTPSGCAPPWHQLSRSFDGRTAWVISTLAPTELERVLDGLKRR